MTKITMFGKLGGSDQEIPLNFYSNKVSKALERVGERVTIEPEIQLHLEYRFDGVYIKYGDPAGCSHLRLMKKKNAIGNTIAVTQDLFDSLNEIELKEFFKQHIILALAQMLERLEKEKYQLNKDVILSLVKKELDNIRLDL